MPQTRAQQQAEEAWIESTPQALIEVRSLLEAEKQAHKDTQRQLTADTARYSNKIAKLRDTIGDLKLAMPSICARSSAGAGGGGGGGGGSGGGGGGGGGAAFETVRVG